MAEHEHNGKLVKNHVALILLTGGVGGGSDATKCQVQSQTTPHSLVILTGGGRGNKAEQNP